MNPTIQLRAFSTRTYLLWLKDRGLVHCPSPVPAHVPPQSLAAPQAFAAPPLVVRPLLDHGAGGAPQNGPLENGPLEKGFLEIGSRIKGCMLCSRSRNSGDLVRAIPDLSSLKEEVELTLVVFNDVAEPRVSGGAEETKSRETSELLGKMLQAIQLQPKDYRVFPSVFCGTTKTEATPADFKACMTHGEKLAEFLRPRVILALGPRAAQAWAGHPYPWESLRGKLFYPPGLSRLGIKIPVLATDHPRDLIRFPEYKKNTWEDLKRLRSYLDGRSQKH